MTGTYILLHKGRNRPRGVTWNCQHCRKTPHSINHNHTFVVVQLTPVSTESIVSTGSCELAAYGNFPKHACEVTCVTSNRSGSPGPTSLETRRAGNTSRKFSMIVGR